DSSLAGISNDGRFVILTSYASNFVTNDDNATIDVFLFDRSTKKVELISKGAAGHSANGPSDTAGVSADGRYVAFSSVSSDVLAGVSGEHSQVLLYDRVSQDFRLLTMGSDNLPGNGDSVAPTVSADGRWVAFTSEASNLVPNDTNRFADVFLYD